ncbi:MAG TPA: pinensin family lanthipeptide [Longimicrobiaceae bacterium]|nr:pinensin family lanthipeptide [Longimicrobiaceae bacterium]
MKKLNLDDLQVDSFVTLPPSAQVGTVRGYATEEFGCAGTEYTHCWGMTCEAHTGCTGGGTLQCPRHTEEYPCTWEPQAMCATNEIAYPTECTGCGQICNQTADHCPGASYPVWNC